MCLGFSLAEHEADGGHREVPEVEGGDAEQETEGAAEVRNHRREGVERLQQWIVGSNISDRSGTAPAQSGEPPAGRSA